MLLPKVKAFDDEELEEEDPRDDLVQKILEYEIYKEVYESQTKGDEE